jgi:hypothetical protein
MASHGRQTRYSDEEIERFRTDKSYLLNYRRKLQNTGSAAFPLFYKGTELQNKAFHDYTEMMRRRLNCDERLCERLIPKFHVGCRRSGKSK